MTTQQAAVTIVHHLFENLPKPLLLHINSKLPSLSSLSHTQQAHTHLIKTGASTDTLLSTKLLSLYANHSRFTDAKLVLSSITKPSVFSYSFLIYGLTKQNLFSQSLTLFSRMVSNGVSPDSHILPNIVKACSGLLATKPGQQVHGLVCVSGFHSDLVVQVSLFHMYVKMERVSDAQKVFDLLPERNNVSLGALIYGYAKKGSVDKVKELLNETSDPGMVSWNGVVAGLSHSGKHYDAIVMFKEMVVKRYKPDDWTICSVLPSIGELQMAVTGFQIHCFVIKRGLGKYETIVPALVDMYGKCKCTFEMSVLYYESEDQENNICASNAFLSGLSRNGLVENALQVFKNFKSQGVELNVISWTSVIACCSQHGEHLKALELFKDMQVAGMKPNYVTIPCLLSACGDLLHGKAAHCFSIRGGFSDDVYVGSGLINMYSKCGRIELARVFFDRMPRKNSICWNAMIDGYRVNGEVKQAMELLHMRLEKKDVE
ncbi:hypothetical protein ACFE04_027425 [Oxalis oulophora]